MEKLTQDQIKTLAPFDKEAFIKGALAVGRSGYVYKCICNDTQAPSKQVVVRDMVENDVLYGDFNDTGLLVHQEGLTTFAGMYPKQYHLAIGAMPCADGGDDIFLTEVCLTIEEAVDQLNKWPSLVHTKKIIPILF